MTTENFSTLPNTNATEAIQAYLESGAMRLYDLAKAWKKGNLKDVTARVVRHFNPTIGQCIGLDINVRDAMQNMVLHGLFTDNDIRVSPTAERPQFVLGFVWQADALLRQLDGRKLSTSQKQWLANLADDLRNAIASAPYVKGASNE